MARIVNPRHHFSTSTPSEKLGKVLDWPVFSSGYHKGKLYTDDDIAKIVRNFNILKNRLKIKARVRAKLGHDPEETLKRSLGLPNVGYVSSVRLSTPNDLGDDGNPVPRNTLVISIEGIPPWVGEQIENGWYNDGSIELDPKYTDPEDPSRPMDGPVLTAIAFLGEEQPQVKGLPAPKLTYSEAHNNQDEPFIQGRVTLVFSEVMNVRDQILQKLQAMGIDTCDPKWAGASDEMLQSLLDQLGGQAFSDAMKKKFSAPPETNPAGTGAGAGNGTGTGTGTGNPAAMSDYDDASGGGDIKQFMSECRQKFGSMEAAIKDLQTGNTGAAAMSKEFVAAHNAEKTRRATEAVDLAIRQGKLMPAQKQDMIKNLCLTSNLQSECFSTGPNLGKTRFDVAISELVGRPTTDMFSEKVDDTGTGEDEFVTNVLSRSRDGRKALAMERNKK